MRILIATDAWHPQLNGVVRTYTRLAEEVRTHGAEIRFVTPSDFRAYACPGYPEIQLAVPDRGRMKDLIETANVDYVHIATEGPVGWMARAYCHRAGLDFTSSYHTKFPEYANKHAGIPLSASYAVLRRFHAPSIGIMVATPSLASDLRRRGFRNLLAWTRGVDATLFRPQDVRLFGSSEPVFLYAGRVSKEKNIEAFLEADLPGRKVVVGDGPHLATLKERYSGVTFTGRKSDAELALCYASADVFVFPSLTDTFGLVILEALASGVPVAAYPVTGPIDIIEDGVSGALDADIASAARRALNLDRRAARERALNFTWSRAAKTFLENVRSAFERNARERTGGTKSKSALAERPSNDPLEIMTHEHA
jgi:glycosyltransferase involved in cell wall biosynthesis